MKLLFKSLAAVCLLIAGGIANAQTTISGQGVPTGQCNPPYALGTIYTNTDPSISAGTRLWTCANNSTDGWEQQGGGTGSGSVSGQASGVIPLGTSSTVIGSQSHLDDGVTTASTISSSENMQTTGTFSAGVGSAAAGGFGFKQGTAAGLVANTVFLTGPTSVQAAGYNCTLPGTEPSANDFLKVTSITSHLCVTSWAAVSGTGTVTSFSAGTLSPLFTTSVATSTTTPALTFALANAAANTVFGNVSGSSGAPTYSAAPAGGTSGCSGSTDAAIYTAGTGWGCHQISAGGGAYTSTISAQTGDYTVLITDLVTTGSLNTLRFTLAYTYGVMFKTFTLPAHNAGTTDKACLNIENVNADTHTPKYFSVPLLITAPASVLLNGVAADTAVIWPDASVQLCYKSSTDDYYVTAGRLSHPLKGVQLSASGTTGGHPNGGSVNQDAFVAIVVPDPGYTFTNLYWQVATQSNNSNVSVGLLDPGSTLWWGHNSTTVSSSTTAAPFLMTFPAAEGTVYLAPGVYVMAGTSDNASIAGNGVGNPMGAYFGKVSSPSGGCSSSGGQWGGTTACASIPSAGPNSSVSGVSAITLWAQ